MPKPEDSQKFYSSVSKLETNYNKLHKYMDIPVLRIKANFSANSNNVAHVIFLNVTECSTEASSNNILKGSGLNGFKEISYRTI